MNRIRTLACLTIAVVRPLALQAQARQDTIPFVGCPADGQTGYLAPPRGSPKVVALHGVTADAIAYYQGALGPGVFAPRGWRCQVAYGSAGINVLVTPDSIDLLQFPQPSVGGWAVEVEHRLAGTSGRFQVAAYAARLFPEAASAFIQRVIAEGLVPDSTLTGERFAQDSVKSLGSRAAEFLTPSGTRGLGTEGYLGPSDDAIRGMAVIAADAEEPDVSIIRVRLGSGMRRVEAAVLELNRVCLLQSGGC